MLAGLCSHGRRWGRIRSFPFPAASGPGSPSRLVAALSPHGLLLYVCLVPWVFYKDLSLDVGPIWIIWQPLRLRILTLIISSKTLFPNTVTCRGSRDEDLGHIIWRLLQQ